jgi:adenylyl- and sulfurtransferase ThiI
VQTFLKEICILKNMDYTHVLLRYGEIFLKGKNRGTFERKLVDNIKKIANLKDVNRIRSRLIVDYFADHKLLKNVFGLVSYSPSIKTEKDVEEIKKATLKSLSKHKGSFKVETKRSDKEFPIKSPELNVIIGKHLEENSKMEFKFKNPEITLHIEINQDGVYIFTEIIPCFGGLPTGVEGKVILLVENFASLLAGLSFMKRGCDIVPVAFKKQDISLLQKYSPKELGLEIVKDIKEFAAEKHLQVLVVGDNFENKKDYPTDLVFRPLIAFNDDEIEEKLEKFI